MPWRLHASQAAPVLAERFGVRADPDVVARTLGDPAFVARAIAAVPGVALAVLEIVVEHQGGIDSTALLEIAQERLELSEHDVTAAVVALGEAGLAFAFEGRSRWGQRMSEIALFDVSAELVARQVWGLTLPEPPRGAITTLPDTSRRDLVALLATAAHLPLRFTQAMRVNMTSCKKLAAVVGRDEQALAALIDRAIGEHLLGANGALLSPRLEPLRALARGERGWAPQGEAGELHRWAPEDRWIAREALVRAMTAKAVRDQMTYGIGAGHARQFRRRVERAIERADLATLEHEGNVFVRRAGGARASGTGDGHVTPSFEVMLGPDCDPSIALVVALAAEPVRFDRVLTRKLTPASIAAALALGLPLDEILDGLGRVGRHGVPDNVRAMVEDWARTARTVRVRKVWALEASTPEAAEQAARALGKAVIGRPSPTLVLVDGEVASPETALAKTGVKVIGAAEPLEKGILRTTHEPESAPPSWIDAFAPAALRARARDRAGLPERAFAPDGALEELAREHEGEVRAFFEDLAELWKAAMPEYWRWAHALPDAKRAEALERAEESPADFLFWLVRTPDGRRRKLERAVRVADLCVVEPLAELRDIGGQSIDVLRALRSPAVMRALASVSELAELAPTEEPRTKKRESSSRGAPDDGRPAPRDLELQSREAVLAALADAMEARTELWVRVTSARHGDRVLALVPELVAPRGKDVALLATDLDTGDSRSFPIARVAAVKPR